MKPFIYNPPTQPFLDIIYQDKDVVVIHKPSGLLSVPGRGEHLADSALTRVRTLVPTAQSVHRLDLWTSGVLVLATRRKAEKALFEQFRARRTQKCYLAVVYPPLPEQALQPQVIEYPLTPDLDNLPLQKVCVKGKAAKTIYRLIGPHDQGSLVGVQLHTGRSHQIRVHFREIGHPIVGDTFYAPLAVQKMAPRLLLHAYSLAFFHPYSGEPMQFTAPCAFANDLPESFSCVF
jgi:tRNA pseudouridine32 synthase / 23S rRNA pseudouridine746 synthase